MASLSETPSFPNFPRRVWERDQAFNVISFSDLTVRIWIPDRNQLRPCLVPRLPKKELQKMMLFPRVARIQQLSGGSTAQRRNFWMWLNFIFNRVDHSRVREVGPDRAAAEWVLRLGGTVKFRDLEFWSSDYNRLPSEPRERMKVEAIDAAGVAITDNGLEHLSGLECLQVLRLSGCNYLSDPGLAHLASVKDSLSELDLSNCGGITHAGLPNLYTLRQLQSLDLTSTPGIRHRDDAISKLQTVLFNCHIRS